MGCALITMLPQVTEAKVVRFVVAQRAPFAEGATFGETGAYQRITGTASSRWIRTTRSTR
jgi:hypothetical protein